MAWDLHAKWMEGPPGTRTQAAAYVHAMESAWGGAWGPAALAGYGVRARDGERVGGAWGLVALVGCGRRGGLDWAGA